MGRILFRDAHVFDGTGRPCFPADVLVEGNRIKAVARDRGQLATDGTETIDAGGRTLMPGLVEGHAHLTFVNGTRNTDIGDMPPEEHLLQTAYNARTLLDHGFTSAYSAASARLRMDLVVRNEINAGRLLGPRLRACGPEITVTGGLGDERQLHQDRTSFAVVADGEDEIVRFARTCLREGVDSIKLNISGDGWWRTARDDMTVMRENEVQAAVEVAHEVGRRVNAHCRANKAVKRAVQCGVDVIYHCEFADGEAMDMLEAAKDRIFVGPAIGLPWAIHEELQDAGAAGDPAIRRYNERTLEASARTYADMRKRGIRVVVGGDYGFGRTPHGRNARDIELFVKLFGYSPAEALACATSVGGEIMDMGGELGRVEAGYLADLLLVDGDPLADVRILQDASRLVAIMKDGRLHKLDASTAGLRLAAE
jgi:imidazolonepropionase-like amidohydrolase